MNEKKDDLFIIPAFSLMKKRDDAVCAGNSSRTDGDNTRPNPPGRDDEDDEEDDDAGFTSLTSVF